MTAIWTILTERKTEQTGQGSDPAKIERQIIRLAANGTLDYRTSSVCGNADLIPSQD